MTEYICSIERFNESEHTYEQVFKAAGCSFRFDPDSGSNYHRPPRALFRFYPLDRADDMESDACMLVCADDVLHPHVDSSYFPEIVITGHMRSLQAYPQVQPNTREGGYSYRYSPPKMEDFKAGSVRIRVWPAGHFMGDNEFMAEFKAKYSELPPLKEG